MNIIQPKPLQKGDSVAIISTARKININEIEAAITLLKEWELKVVIGNTIGKEYCQYAGTDQERINDLQNMLNNDNIKAIWCARGGYGSVRLIDAIDFSKFKISPKWIIGFSDVTVLHSHIHNLGIKTLHALMPITLKDNTIEAKNSLHAALFNSPIRYKVPFSKYNKTGESTGQLVGGNLSILYSLTGSSSAINTDGKILFIEDLDEYLYHIDRMMMNLKRNGYLSKIKGLIVGSMTKMHDNTISFGKNTQEIILDSVLEYDFPVCFNFPAGHINDNRTLIFGKEVSLVVTNSYTSLTVL